MADPYFIHGHFFLTDIISYCSVIQAVLYSLCVAQAALELIAILIQLSKYWYMSNDAWLLAFLFFSLWG